MIENLRSAFASGTVSNSNIIEEFEMIFEDHHYFETVSSFEWQRKLEIIC